MNNIAIFNTCISGSTGKIAVGLFKKLKESGYRVVFFFGREDGQIEEGFVKIGTAFHKYSHALIAKSMGLQGFGSFFPTRRVIKKLNREKIDTVFIVSPHGYYINEKLLWNYIINNNISVVYLMIDEYAFLGNCGYRNGCENYKRKCLNCPNGFWLARLVHGASKVYRVKEMSYGKCEKLVFVGPQFTILQAHDSPLMQGKKLVALDEAVNTAFFTPRNTDQFKERLGIKPYQRICVCIAPYSYERKGCVYFLELARRFVSDENYVFVQVGFNVNPKTVQIPLNYIPIGFIRDQEELARYYSLGDLFIFPSLLDTMPNACLEALSCGTPLLLFNTSGMSFIADNTVATYVEAKNLDQMEMVVRKMQKKTEKVISTCRSYALKRYDSAKYYKRLIEIANEL